MAATAVVGMLAVGIGANSTVFSFVNAFVLRPPAVRDPTRVVGLFAQRVDKPGIYESFSVPDYRDLREGRSLADIFAYGIVSANLSIEERSRTLLGELVSANYFAALEVALQGRGFLPEENEPGAHPAVVVSSGLWKREFSADAGLIGRTITLNGRPFTVVGIAPAGFRGTMTGISAEFWVPLGVQAWVRPGADLEDRSDRWLELGAVLAEGTSRQQAQAVFDTLAQRLEREYPDVYKNRRIEVRGSLVRPEIGTALVAVSALLLAIVGLVLVIACINVANLFLARAADRRREIAVRLALGVPRGRLVRQLLTESALLACAGGLLGLVLARLLTHLLVRLQPPIPLSVSLDIGLDWRVLAYTAALSLATGILFGLTPALQATRSALVPALRGAPGERQSRGGMTRVLVTGEIVATLVLLFTAVLFLRSLNNAQTIDPGFRTPGGLVVALPQLDLSGYGPAQGMELYRQLDQRLVQLPGVTQAALASVVPLGLVSDTLDVQPEGAALAAGTQPPRVDYAAVTADYFSTLGISILRGRDFDGRDVAGAPRVAVVNEAFVRRFWPDADPLGRRVTLPGADPAAVLEVVGVVPTGKYRSVGEQPRPYLYMPLAQRYQSMVFAVLRIDGDAAPIVATVRREVQSLAPNLPPADVKTLSAHVGLSLWPARMAAKLLGGLGSVALLMAVAGLYAVMAYSVSGRVREVGVRMALGARPRDVQRLVIGEALKLSGRGIVLGLLAAFLAARLVSSFLYGAGGVDPVAVLGVPAMVGLVSVLAAYVPARRAMSVDPAVALRQQE